MNNAPESQDVQPINTHTDDTVASDTFANTSDEKPRRPVAFYVFVGVLIIGILQLLGAVPLFIMNDTAGLGTLFGVISVVMAVPFILVGLIGARITKSAYRKKSPQVSVRGVPGNNETLPKTNRRWLYIFFGVFLLSVAIRVMTDKFGDEIVGSVEGVPFEILILISLYQLWVLMAAISLLGVISTTVIAFVQRLRTGHSDYKTGTIIGIAGLTVLIACGYVAAAAYREAEYTRLTNEADRAISQVEAIKLIQTCQVKELDEYDGEVSIIRMNSVVLETGWSGSQSGYEVTEQDVANADIVALNQELSNVIDSGKCDGDIVDPRKASNNL